MKNTKKPTATGISVLRKHMGLKHPPKLCNQLSHVTLPLRAESWMSPDWGQEAVRAGQCVTAGSLLGVEEMPPRSSSSADLVAAGWGRGCFGKHVAPSLTQR